MTSTTFRLAQARQLTVRKILFGRFDALVRGARVSDAFVQFFSAQRLQEFKLAQAESAVRFALRHNGQEPANRLLGATRALAAAITELVAERAERDKLECAVKELFADASACRSRRSPLCFLPARLRAARRRAPFPLVRAQARPGLASAAAAPALAALTAAATSAVRARASRTAAERAKSCTGPQKAA
jgi:hypothetical protein